MNLALLSDFGHEDPYVGIMKGVLLSRCPEARVVDLCHGIRPHDVRAGALALMAAVAHFPPGTLFVCVVDPGVGSGRTVLWARGARHGYLAPDNGLLSWAARLDPFREVRAVTNRRLFLPDVSRTFHGRDIFAPVAAALASGTPAGSLGPKRASWTRIKFPAARRRGRVVRGEILAFDRFGNAVTNLPSVTARGAATVYFRKNPFGHLRRSYADVAAGRPLAVSGSLDFVELAVREGSFQADFAAELGEAVYVR